MPPGAKPRTGFFLHPDASLHDTGWAHPEHQGRLRALSSVLSKDLLVLHDRVDQRASPTGAEEDVMLVHAPEHVARVRAAWREACRLEKELQEAGPEALGEGFGTGVPQARSGKSLVALDADTVVSAMSWSAALGGVGGAVEACSAVAQGTMANAFVATRPPGHHATPTEPMGFCLFNNVAVAARALQARGDAERVLILDWDVHHGNGTQDAFYDDPTVFYLSLHQSPWYPGTGAPHERGAGAGEGFTLNLPLPAGTDRERYHEVFRSGLDTALSGFDPDFVLISAGFDAIAGDPLGGLLLEPEDFWTMTREVMEVADRCCGGRVVALLEGGYDPKRTALGALAVIRALAGVSLSEAPTPFQGFESEA
jgi:acetoin utilization deacetylase AcuC-like enzyme